MPLQCPKCGHFLSGYRRDRDRLRLELGLCVDCAGPKTEAEVGRGMWRCRACRQKRANRMAAKRYRGIDVEERVDVTAVRLKRVR